MRLSAPRPVALRVVVGLAAAAALGLVAAAVGLALEADAERWPLALSIAGGVAAAGWVVAGAIAWLRRPTNPVGVLMVAVGAGIGVTLLNASERPLPFTVSVALPALFVAPLVHLVLAYPSGRLGAAWLRVGVLVGWLICTVGLLPWVVAHDPRAESCASCPENLLYRADTGLPRADVVPDLFRLYGVAAIIVGIVRLALLVRAASPVARRALLHVAIALGAATACVAAGFLASTLGRDDVAQLCLAGLLLVLLDLPFAMLAGLLRARLGAGARLGALARSIAAVADVAALDRVVRDALADPSARIAFPRADGTLVAADGTALEARRDAACEATPIVVRGHEAAVILHDPLLAGERELVGAVAAAGLVLDRLRLQAELAARARDIASSRTAMLGVADRERRALEARLADGAGRALAEVATGIDAARGALPGAPDAAAARLDAARASLDRALDELRAVARGLHPAVLHERGLDPAVGALAARAPLALTRRIAPEPLPAEISLAAYRVIADAVRDAAGRGATAATVAVDVAGGDVRVTVDDDGTPRPDARAFADLGVRLAALDGTLRAGAGPDGAARVEAVLPLAGDDP